MSIVSEFREFAVKGNVVDMAVGIIIGAAFGKIVSSLVSDIVTPPLGYLIGGVDFTKLAVTLPSIRDGAEAVTIRYGVFLQALLDFINVAFAIFLLVKLINRVRRKDEAAPSAPPPPSTQKPASPQWSRPASWFTRGVRPNSPHTHSATRSYSPRSLRSSTSVPTARS